MPPALAAACTGIKGRDRKRESIGKKVISLLFILITYNVTVYLVNTTGGSPVYDLNLFNI